MLFGAGEEDVNAAGGVNVLEARVRAVAKAEEDLVRLRVGSDGRRGDGTKPPPPGCAFAVFRDPLTARRALTALKRTHRGASVALAWHAWMLPFAAAWALGPGFGGDKGGDSNGGGNADESRATAAAARRDAARRDTRLNTNTGLDAADDDADLDLTEPLIVGETFAPPTRSTVSLFLFLFYFRLD